MVAIEGYADAAALWGMTRGWLSLAQLSRADLIVADHSPGALLAGRILGLPRACIGTGFKIPPRRSPLPSIRPWESVPEDRLQRSERAVLKAINGVIRSFRGGELDHLADLFDIEARIFLTFAELDPYGPRDERYLGPIYDADFGEPAAWPEGERPRIYAYLRASVPGAANILRVLGKAEASTLCFIPDIRPETVKSLASDRPRIASRPLHLAAILPQADLAVSYGGHGVVGAALVAGVPSLVVPQNVEQYLHARRVESLGAGIVVDEDRRLPSIASHIKKALANPGLRAAAREFSVRHAGFDPMLVVAEAAKTIDGLRASGTGFGMQAQTLRPLASLQDGVTPLG